MRYLIEHSTVYQYAAPVSASHQIARLEPRHGGGQRLHSFRLEVEPMPGAVHRHVDFHGNAAHSFSLHESHRALAVHARSEVEVEPPPPLPSAGPLAAIRAALRAEPPPPEAATLHARDFLVATPLTSATSAIAAYAAAVLPDQAPLPEALRALCAALQRDFTFVSGATEVSTPAEAFFAERRGVCQDFAHLALACLRTRGLAACYCSGYLRTDPPPGQPRLRGVDASHAWVAVWCPGHGWLDWDPTNDRRCDESHVLVARGRDFRDVSPLRGTVTGGGPQTLQLGVTVTPLD